MRNYLKRAFLVLLALSFFSVSGSWAQSIVTGGIAGTITDATGAVVGEAKLTLKNTATGETFSNVSSAGGDYLFPLMKPGDYTLTVTKDGFKTATRPVTVVLGTTVNASLALEVGSASTTVEVSVEQAQLQTENANISTNFETKQIQEVPNPGGDVTYVAQTAPGVTMSSAAGGGYGNFSTFGLPGTSNLFTINGNDYNDPFLNLNNTGSSNLLLGGNELQEVSVVNNAYTGEYGRQAASQIDYTTKSGSNSFHGNAVYNWTGRYLNANDPLLNAAAQPRPFENNNQWAASLGGPVIKDKLFFFVNTEGIRYIFGAVKPVTTPTLAFENYTLANILTKGTPTVAFYQNMFKLWNSAPGIAAAVPNAKSCSSNGVPATGLLITDQCTQSWTDSSPSGNNEWLLSARIDYSFNDNNKIFGRMKFDRGTQPTYTDTISRTFDTFSTQPQNEGQLNYTHVFNPTVVNNFIGSVLWYSAIFGGITPTSPALALFPGNLALSDGSLTNLGFGSGSGGYANGFFFPQGRNVTQWGLVDDLSVTRGNHSFKMGLNWRRDDISDHTAAETTIYPAVNTTLLGLATDTLTGGPGNFTNFNFAKSPVQPVAFYSMGFYFQDEFRATSKLKMTLALRADRNSGGACQHNCASLPIVPFSQLAHGATVPYDQSFQTGRKTIIPSNELVAFQPRFGLAWSPRGDKTVIRAGVGLFADLYPGTILSPIDTNFPQVNLWNIAGGSLAWDQKPPATTAFPGSGVSIVQTCNSIFTNNYFAGGNYNTYLAAAPFCTNTGLPAGTIVNGAPSLQSVPALNDVSRSLQNPKYVEWNLEVQHMLTPHTIFKVNYVGNRGFSELYYNNYLNGFAGPGQIGFGVLPLTAPDPRVARVNFLQSGAVSNYNGMTVSIEEHNWHGLSGRFNYTYSHALDESSNGGILPWSIYSSVLAQINPQTIRSNYASADYDARHQITVSYIYALPFKSTHRLLNTAIADWQVSGTFFYRTGFPFSVDDTATVTGLTGQNLGGATNPGPAILLQPLFSKRNFSNGGACVAAPCFGILAGPNPALPGQAAINPGAPYQFQNPYFTNSFTGAVGRNAFTGPGFLAGDMSLRKNFRINERFVFQLGLNAYNWFNHANYGTPFSQTIFGPSNFGKTIFTSAPPTSPYGAFASAATDMRMAQITARLTF